MALLKYFPEMNSPEFDSILAQLTPEEIRQYRGDWLRNAEIDVRNTDFDHARTPDSLVKKLIPLPDRLQDSRISDGSKGTS